LSTKCMYSIPKMNSVALTVLPNRILCNSCHAISFSPELPLVTILMTPTVARKRDTGCYDAAGRLPTCLNRLPQVGHGILAPDVRRQGALSREVAAPLKPQNPSNCRTF